MARNFHVARELRQSAVMERSCGDGGISGGNKGSCGENTEKAAVGRYDIRTNDNNELAAHQVRRRATMKPRVPDIGRSFRQREGTMRKAMIIALALCGLFAFGRAAMAEGATVAEIKKALSGNTTEGSNRHGTAMRVLHAANGEVVFALENGNYSDRGKWWIPKDGVVCYQWEKIGGGNERCSTNVHFDADGRYVATNADGKTGKAKILQGNQVGF
jgi:hypothetical protein